MDSTENTPLYGGGSGEGYVLPGKGLKDARLERMAIKRRWKVKLDKRIRMLERQVEIAINPEYSAKEATSAFNAVVNAEKADDERQAKREKQGDTFNFYQQNNHHGGAVVSVALTNPAYLEFLRTTALGEDSVTGSVCQNGEQRPVENGQALNGHRPGTNGSHKNGQCPDHP